MQELLQPRLSFPRQSSMARTLPSPAVDDPRRALIPCLDHPLLENVDWTGSLQAIIRTQTVLTNPSKCRSGEQKAILHMLIKMLRDAAGNSNVQEHALREPHMACSHAPQRHVPDLRRSRVTVVRGGGPDAHMPPRLLRTHTA